MDPESERTSVLEIGFVLQKSIALYTLMRRYFLLKPWRNLVRVYALVLLLAFTAWTAQEEAREARQGAAGAVLLERAAALDPKSVELQDEIRSLLAVLRRELDPKLTQAHYETVRLPLPARRRLLRTWPR